MADKQAHDPALGVEGQVESRDETLERVLHEDAEYREQHGIEEDPELGGSGGDTGEVDPSTNRGLNLALVVWFGGGAVIGAGLGLLLGLGLVQIVGDNTLKGTGDVAFPVSLALVGALVGAILAAYVQLSEEDGRVERTVDDETGQDHDLGAGPDPGSRPVGGLISPSTLPVLLGAIGIALAFTGIAAIASIGAIVLGLRVRARATRIRQRGYGNLGVVAGVVGLALTVGLLIWGATVFG